MTQDKKARSNAFVFGFTLAAAGASYLMAAYYLHVPALHLVLERIRSRIPR